MNRNEFLKKSAWAGLGAVLWSKGFGMDSTDQAAVGGYKVGLIDLMLLKRQKIGALDLAAELGANGIEVDMGSLGQRETFESRLADPIERQAYLDKAKSLGIEICSLAMTGFYAQSLATRPTYQRMVGDCIDTMVAMGVKVAFLPFGVQGDLVQNPELRPALVDRMKVIAQRAQDAGVTVGIETAYDAAGELRFLEDVGSDHVKSYFNFSNALKNGRDLHNELRILGADRICHIHCTDEDGVWLEHNERLDMATVKETLDDMGWRGWLVIERSRDANNPRDVKGNYGANTRFMKKVFQDG